MRPAQDLAAILAEARSLKSDLEALRKVRKAFAIRTTYEIDELFVKVDARVQGRPGRKQTCVAKAANCPKS